MIGTSSVRVWRELRSEGRCRRLAQKLTARSMAAVPAPQTGRIRLAEERVSRWCEKRAIRERLPEEDVSPALEACPASRLNVKRARRHDLH